MTPLGIKSTEDIHSQEREEEEVVFFLAYFFPRVVVIFVGRRYLVPATQL